MVAGAAFLVPTIIVYVGIGLLAMLPIILMGSALGFDTFARAGSPNIAFQIYHLLLSLFGTWIGARLCLTGAIMGAGNRLEPFSAMAESWRLTREAQGRLFAFYFVYGLIVAAAFGGLVLLHGAVIWNNAQAPGTVLETAMSFGWVLLFAAYFLGQILFAAGFLRSARPAAGPAEIFA